MRIFERWYVWLVLKLEICYRVLISWRILVSFRGFFEDYIFAWWNIWVSIILHLLWDTFWCKWQGDNVTHPLFCFFYHIKISQTMALHATHALVIVGKLSMSIGVHQIGLRLFGATMWKLLIIEPFPQQWLK